MLMPSSQNGIIYKLHTQTAHGSTSYLDKAWELMNNFPILYMNHVSHLEKTKSQTPQKTYSPICY